MTYLPYIVAAYAVFAVVLGLDFLAAHLAVRRELRAARRRAARGAARSAPRPSTTNELSR